MPKAVKFIDTFFENGAPKYEAGKTYPATEETVRQIACGHAVEVNVKASEIESAPLDDAEAAAAETPAANAPGA